MLAKAEQLGGEGNVEEAQKVLENVEKSRALKKEAEVKIQLGVLFVRMSRMNGRSGRGFTRIHTNILKPLF